MILYTTTNYNEYVIRHCVKLHFSGPIKQCGVRPRNITHDDCSNTYDINI